MNNQSKRNKIVWSILLFLLILATLFSGWFFFADYGSVKAFIDFVTPDGNLEFFSNARYLMFRPFMLGFGLLALVKSLYFIFSPIRSQALLVNIIQWLRRFLKDFKQDRKNFFKMASNYLKANKDWQFVGILMVIGIVLRVLLLDKPMGHDESYTYVAFASRDFIYVIGDYHLPNNHILHSIFVYFSTRLLGIDPWMIRLPSMIAGVLLIPASYLAGRHYFNRHSGLLLSCIMAVFPAYILVSTSARGYAQLSLISIVIWFLAGILKTRKNLFVWLLFVLFSAAGFYTIPTMLYPFSAIMIWLFLSWILGDTSDQYKKWEFFTLIILSGLMVVAFTAILYIPVFYLTGIDVIFSNTVVSGMKVDSFELFLGNFANRGGRAWLEWHEEIPLAFNLLLLAGFGASIVLHKKMSRHKINFLVLSFSVIFVLIAAQKTMAWVRVWFFYASFYFAFAAAGLIKLGSLFAKNNKRISRYIFNFLILLILFFSFSWIFGQSKNMALLRGEPGGPELSSIYISEVIKSTDTIVGDSSDSPAIWYYSELYGVPYTHFDVSNQDFNFAYVIVNSPSWTLESVLAQRGGILDRVKLEQANLVYSAGNFEVYSIPIILFDN